MDMPEFRYEFDFDAVNRELTHSCDELKDLAAQSVLARKSRPLIVPVVRGSNTTKHESDSSSDSDSDSKSRAWSDSVASSMVPIDGSNWSIGIVDCRDVEVNIESASPSSASQSASSTSLMSASASNTVQVVQSGLSHSDHPDLVILTKKHSSHRDSGIAQVRAEFQRAGKIPSKFLKLAELYETRDGRRRVDVRADCGDLWTFIQTYFDPRVRDYEEKDVIEFNARLSRRFFAQIVQAVASLHSVGLALIDPKPENILVYNGDHIKVIDFEECIKLNENGLFKEFLLGKGGGFTEGFSSPEYEEAQRSPNLMHAIAQLDLRAHDCFALGVILGLLVWGANRKNAEFKKLLSGLTQKNPKKRYTLEQVMKSPFFGSNPREFFVAQEQLCCSIAIDDFILNGALQSQDGFLFVPTTTKPVIVDVEQLIAQTNGLIWATKHVKQDAFTICFMIIKTYQKKKSVITKLETAMKASRREKEVKLLAELQSVVKGKALEVLDCAPYLEKALPYFAQVGRLTVEDGPYKSLCNATLGFTIDYCIRHPVAASTDRHAELFALLDELLAVKKNEREEQVPVILAKYQRLCNNDECALFLATQLGDDVSPEREVKI